jgi:hypothetical protein
VICDEIQLSWITRFFVVKLKKMEKPIGPAEPITRHHRVPPLPPRPFRHPPSEREGREERGREASERLGERDGEESDEETLIVAYVLGAFYQAELGLSGLGLLTEAGFLQITASEKLND